MQWFYKTAQIAPEIYQVGHSLFPALRHPQLAAVCRDSQTLILYPGPKSQNLEELVQYQEVGAVKHNVIIIDGTWSQAKNMFLKNSLLHLPKQVCISVVTVEEVTSEGKFNRWQLKLIFSHQNVCSGSY